MANIVGGSVVWNLDLNQEEFARGLEKARDQISGIDSAMRKAEKGSLLFAGGLGAITAGLGFGIKLAGEMEMLRASLNTLTGSAEAGAKVFKELNEFAASTPFETTDLAKASQTMLAFGTTAEDVLPNLRMLGDISLGNAEKLSGLTLAFSQVQSTGRLMGQDLLQMINQGFNPLTIISQKTGKSMAELKKEMEKGAISFEMVRDAMVTATSEGGLFFEGMKRGAQTLPGLLSTLTDTVNMTIRSFVGLSDTGEIVEGGLIDTVKNAVEGLITFLNDNKKVLTDFFEDGLGWVQDNGYIVAGIILGGLTPAFYVLATGIWAALTPLIPFLVIGAALGFIVKTIVDRMGGWEEVMKKLQPTLDLLGDVFSKYILPDLKELWKQISEELVPALKDLWNILQPIVIPVLKVLAAVLGVALIVAIKAVIAIIKLWVTVISEAVKGVVRFFNWLYDTLVGNSIIPDLINSIKDWFARLPNMVRSALSSLVSAITKPFSDAYNKIKDIVDDIKNAMKKISPFHRDSPSLVDNVTSGVSRIIKEYKDLNSINIRPVVANTSVSPSSFEDFDFENRGSREVIVNVDTVNNASDVEALEREIGFKASIA